MIPWIEFRMILMIICYRRGGYIVRSPPKFDLLNAVLLNNFFLVSSNKVAVAALVQAPMLINRYILLSNLHEY